MPEKLELLLKGVFAASASLALLYAGLTVLPRLSGYEPYAVTSGSMEPAIHKGSLIYVNTNDRLPQVGKVMTCRTSLLEGAMPVTHRVFEIEENGDLVLKGDANRTPDPNRITSEQIIGTVVKSIDHLGVLIHKSGLRTLPLLGMGLSAAGTLILNQTIRKKGA